MFSSGVKNILTAQSKYMDITERPAITILMSD
jgi:hypothetical protein